MNIVHSLLAYTSRLVLALFHFWKMRKKSCQSFSVGLNSLGELWIRKTLGNLVSILESWFCGICSLWGTQMPVLERKAPVFIQKVLPNPLRGPPITPTRQCCCCLPSVGFSWIQHRLWPSFLFSQCQYNISILQILVLVSALILATSLTFFNLS